MKKYPYDIVRVKNVFLGFVTYEYRLYILDVHFLTLFERRNQVDKKHIPILRECNFLSKEKLQKYAHYYIKKYAEKIYPGIIGSFFIELGMLDKPPTYEEAEKILMFYKIKHNI